MNQETVTVNTVAPLQNVARCMQAMQRTAERAEHLPGLIAFYGPSGWGKSTAAAYVANRYRAYYVEAKSTWTKKALLLAVLTEMGVQPGRTIYEMADQAAEQLALSGRPLIVDEFDYVVDKKNVEIVRDLYESSNAPILIIGEERLEANLKRWERFHNRILDWVPAQPANLEDARHLRELYCRRVTVGDDLLERILEVSRGTTRRICVNLARVQEWAIAQGLDSVALDDWGSRPLFDGQAPKRRI